jgi:hypothetical protein
MTQQYKVEKVYFVEANSDFDAYTAANKQGIANKIVIGPLTEQDAQELQAMEEAAAKFRKEHAEEIRKIEEKERT